MDALKIDPPPSPARRALGAATVDGWLIAPAPGPLGRLMPMFRAMAERAAAREPDPYIEALEEIRSGVKLLIGGRRKRKPGHLSFREAATQLRIDRNTTLKDLISTGQLRTIQVQGKLRVPSSEVERLCAEGFDSKKGKVSRKRPTTTKPGSTDPASWNLKL